jgi:L-fuculose-phosphate aldolase
MNEQCVREEICLVGRLLYERGYIAGHDGNISVLTAPDRFLITPSGVSKGRMTPEMLLLCDLQGEIIEGSGSPSSEEKMHRMVYSMRGDVRAVVHAHPPVSTAFSVCRRGLDLPCIAGLVAGLGTVPVTKKFAMLSTEEVPDSIMPYLTDYNALLLANHGSLAWGMDLWQAFDRLETVEHTAKIFMYAELLGGAVPLTENQVWQLQNL